jgi:hypothetical protein
MVDYSKPENRFVSWWTDDDHPDLEAEVNYAVADSIGRLELFACDESGVLVLRLENNSNTADGAPFVRPVTFETLRRSLDELEWDNAEEHADLLARAFEGLAARLRAGKGTFGDR